MEGRRGLSTPTTQICISFDDIRGWLGNLRKIMSMMGMQCVQANDEKMMMMMVMMMMRMMMGMQCR